MQNNFEAYYYYGDEDEEPIRVKDHLEVFIPGKVRETKTKYNVSESYLCEINESTTLYHRSTKEFQPGDILDSKYVKQNGKHWLENITSELELEKFRKNNYPDRPSRFDSVFLSVVPKARFLSKGFLYEVKPIGDIFVTNSQTIDKLIGYLGMTPERAEILFHSYWNPQKEDLGKDQVNNLEVLSDRAQVIRKVEEKEDLNVGDEVELIRPVLLDYHGYQKDGNNILTDYQIQKLLSHKILQVKVDSKYPNFYEVKIPKGTAAIVSRIRKNDKGSLAKYRSLDISIPGLEFTHFNILADKYQDVKYDARSNWKNYLRKV